MAIYHFSMQPISRSAGRTATAAAAYRAGCVIVDARTGEIHDYTRKGGVLSARLILPGGGTTDRAAFWSRVEVHHKHPRAVTAREINIALPRELSAEQRRELAEQYGRELADRYGVAVDVCLHGPDGDNDNWHVHILMTACSCTPQGVLGKKVEALDPISVARAKRKENAVDGERPAWAALANAALAAAGRAERIDHRTLEDQGIDRAPTTHDGPARTAIKRRLLAAVEAAQQAIEAIEAELASVVREAAQAAAVAAAAVVAVAAPSLAIAEAPEPVQEAPEASQAAPEVIQATAAAPAVVPAWDRDALRAAVAAARAAAAAAAAPEVVASQAAAPQAPDVPAVAEGGPRAAAEAAVPAPPTAAAERLAKLSARRERARQVAAQAAKAAAPYWLAEDAATAARQRLDALAVERQERERAIADRPWLHRLAALPADPDKKRIAEILAEAGKAQAALQRAEAAMGKAQPLHDAQASADAAVDSLDRAVATAERQCKVEAERLRIAALIEQQADRQDDAGQKDAAGRPRGA